MANFTVRVLNRLVPSQDPQYPQTQLLEDVYKKLLQAYRIEALCGRFDDVPHRTLETVRDKNFLRFLEFSKKILIYLGDEDRCYRAWMGLFFLLIRDNVETLSLAEAGKCVNKQWEYQVDETVFQHFAELEEKEAREIILANYLYNLVQLNLNRGEKTK